MAEIVAQNSNWLYQNHLLNELATIRTKSVNRILKNKYKNPKWKWPQKTVIV